jgi:hypothetical protein
MQRFRSVLISVLALLALAAAACDGAITLPPDGRGRLAGSLDGERWVGNAIVVRYPNGRMTVVATRESRTGREVFHLRAHAVGDGHVVIVDRAGSDFLRIEGGDIVAYAADVTGGTVAFTRIDTDGGIATRAVGTFEVVIDGDRGRWRFRGTFDARAPAPPPS